jgi:hypothetical protein
MKHSGQRRRENKAVARSDGLAPMFHAGEDCVTLIVRDDGSLGWGDEDGVQSEDSRGHSSVFSVRDLLE